MTSCVVESAVVESGAAESKEVSSNAAENKEVSKGEKGKKSSRSKEECPTPAETAAKQKRQQAEKEKRAQSSKQHSAQGGRRQRTKKQNGECFFPFRVFIFQIWKKLTALYFECERRIMEEARCRHQLQQTQQLQLLQQQQEAQERRQEQEQIAAQNQTQIPRRALQRRLQALPPRAAAPRRRGPGGVLLLHAGALAQSLHTAPHGPARLHSCCHHLQLSFRLSLRHSLSSLARCCQRPLCSAHR
uniref:Uncharacterized protein n=1 Tax=Ditylum brightwellii TaxID=49249 RepID=A0A7S4VS46_9STRA|mmetsp:Transcript_30621/g.40690  ORF Transcript_30621/g.40690 Transcript_30621/m.40690 type:complete len:245 (+) Transcript_30621:95-829(+)